MTIEFDPRKNVKNIRKHGISFETASLVFDNEFADEGYDELHSISEDRYWIIGRVYNHFIFVVYTMRGDTIRIISARLATKGEIERYFSRIVLS